MSRCVRLVVEPVEVELNAADGSLALAALQSAYPSASGLYYRTTGVSTDNGDAVKCVVRFDGRKFHPPPCAKQLYVNLAFSGIGSSLSVRRREDAERQFERSAALVRSLMDAATSAASIITAPTEPGLSSRRADEPALFSRIGTKLEINKNNVETKENEPEETMTKRDGAMEELHRQFVELSAVCAGKNTLLVEQRRHLDTTRAQLADAERREADTVARYQEAECRTAYLEQELSLFRNAAADGEHVCHGIEVLVAKLAELERQSELRIGQLETLNADLHKRCEEQSERVEALTSNCLNAEATMEGLRAERAQLAASGADAQRHADDLLVDNCHVHHANDELRTELEACRRRLTQVERKSVDVLRRVAAAAALCANSEIKRGSMERIADGDDNADQEQDRFASLQRLFDEIGTTIGDEKSLSLRNLSETLPEIDGSCQDVLFSYIFN